MPTTAQPATMFHLSVNVSDLERSVAFYRTLFGCAPAKCRVDYAKFELSDPPLVFSLEPQAPQGQGLLNHAGFRLKDREALEGARQRLARAGIDAQQEEGVECCYSRQTKFWTKDPDGCLWEVYFLEEDLEHRGAGQSVEQIRGSSGGSAAPALEIGTSAINSPEANRPRVWDHHLGQPLELPGDMDPSPFDEVRLSGSFNVPVDHSCRDQFLAKVFSVLRPGGRVVLHQLTADQEVASPFSALPGPAAVVGAAPLLTGLLESLSAAGFTQARLIKYNSSACFRLGPVQLRETRLEAYRPLATDGTVTVVYRGPFAGVSLDDGTGVQRGVPAQIGAAAWQGLQAAGKHTEFTLISDSAPAACGTGAG